MTSTSPSPSPSPSPVTASPVATVAAVKPKVGGIYINVLFTGGPRDPLLARSFPLSPYMERDRKTTMKVRTVCDGGIKEEFQLKKSEESDMHSFKTESDNNLKNYGCDSVFYMKENGQFVYMLESLGPLSFSKIRAQEPAYRAACKYHDQNLDRGKLLLKNSIEPSIRKSMHHHNLPTDGLVSYYNALCNLLRH